MRNRLTLTSLGLLIIAIPVVLQLVSMSIYSTILDRFETAESEEYTLLTVYSHVNWVSTLACAATLGWLGHATIGDEKAESLYKLSVEHSAAEIEKLKSVLSPQNELIAQGAERLNHLFAVLDQTNSSPLDRAQIQELSTHEIIPSIEQLSRVRKQLDLSETAKASGLNELAGKHFRQELRTMMWELTAMSIFAAVLLFVIYTRSITGRLRIIADNASRFAQHLPLNPPLTGTAEVVQVDAAFHEMSRALIEAEQRKQQFISMISHDLRTPLTAVVGALELISAGKYGSLSERGNDMLSGARENVQMLLMLVNQLLEIERLEAGLMPIEKAPFPVCDALRRAVDSVSVIAERQNINIVCPHTAVEGFGDEEQIVQVLVNLLGNAIKFSPSGSTITIDVQGSDARTGGTKINVTDQGRGVPKEAQERIFQRFQQVHVDDARQKGGSGLGLAICKAIIEGHKGEIGVDIAEGKGSTFWFVIPNS